MNIYQILQILAVFAGFISAGMLYFSFYAASSNPTFTSIPLEMLWKSMQSTFTTRFALGLNFAIGIAQALSPEAYAVNGSWPIASLTCAGLGLVFFGLGKQFIEESQFSITMRWLSPWFVVINVIAVTLFTL